jgi:BirA family biotin operon repressor/biotin-[acetyl-CoA-carboxylase] ligase
MVNDNKQEKSGVSTKAGLLMALRAGKGKISGSKLASDLGISRVAVWKGIQSLVSLGYPIETQGTGYFLNTSKTQDFLYPWEFGEKESSFRFYESTGSTMDRAREFAMRDSISGIMTIAGRQSAGRGRNGRTWASRQGGLFCTFLDRPVLTPADYCLPSMLYQIAIARVLGSVCGKAAKVRWPNDIYIDDRKIAGIITDFEAGTDMIKWVAIGFGVNVNNQVPSGRAVSCTELTGNILSRRDILAGIIREAQQLKKQTSSGGAYAQGNRHLAAEWNSMSDCIGSKAAVIDSGFDYSGKLNILQETKGRLLAKGIFSGIDPAGRCIIKSAGGKETLLFNPGPVSVVLY